MHRKTAIQRCILTIIVHGFDEAETIHMISILRQASLCVKSVGMTSGLVSGAHGVCLMPDLAFSDLDRLTKTMSISAIILPENKQCLTRLEADPRLSNFLRQGLAQGAHVVVGAQGKQFLKRMSVGDSGLFESGNGGELLLLGLESGQSMQILARDLAYKMGQPLRV